MTARRTKRSTCASYLALAVVMLVLTAGSARGYANPNTTTATIHGTGISRLPEDTRKLTINAQSEGAPTSASGFVQFIHNSPIGVSRFRGTVSCLTIGETGLVQVSGTVLDGVTAAGVVLDGKDYAFTIRAGTSPQTFSLPRFGDPGTLTPCGGGRLEMVTVTQAGFQITD